MSEWPWDDLPGLGPGSRPRTQGPDGERRTLLSQRLETDAEAVERDLMKLVLTIIELVRQLMEKQALRRVDEGDLTDEQVEGLGSGLMHLEQAMEDLKGRYGLTAEDLNIDLGPLGTLLPE